MINPEDTELDDKLDDLISAKERHLEHILLALDFPWSSESLELVTLGDRHHLDSLVVIRSQ
jgi:hypothetical protein